ncbi:hypothetical protein HYW99_00995, partial [Candidatus Woesearchaeota archaeon]|nr:hypothetical protein [Candidatus Woesearchaeota archaeon]
MHKARFQQFIASILIGLIVTLPFYTSNVYATINSASAKGGDGIEGFLRQSDFINFNVHASINGDVITEDQVILGTEIKFDKCKPSTTDYECTLRFPSTGQESFNAEVPYTITLYKDDKTVNDTESGSLFVDNKAPQVTLSTTKSLFSSQENVVINYEV